MPYNLLILSSSPFVQERETRTKDHLARTTDLESVITSLQRQLRSIQDEHANLTHKHEELTLRTRRLTDELEEQSGAKQGLESTNVSLLHKARTEKASSLAELQSANEQLTMLSTQLTNRDQVIVSLRNDLESIGTKDLFK